MNAKESWMIERINKIGLNLREGKITPVEAIKELEKNGFNNSYAKRLVNSTTTIREARNGRKTNSAFRI